MEIELQDLKSYLATSQVAKEYGLSRQSVLEICDAGLLGCGAVKTSLGWLISQKAAARRWGRKEVKEKKEEEEEKTWNKAIKCLKGLLNEQEILPKKVTVDIQEYPTVTISFVEEKKEYNFTVKK